jgi:NAD(P)-dependent dehydrogenase (short-subunit alcohol dehydrogenase family)
MLSLHQDVTKEDEWRRVVSEAEAVFGPVSVLVNNDHPLKWLAADS